MCSLNPVHGFAEVEHLAKLLAAISEDDQTLLLTKEQQDQILKAWNKLDDHDQHPHKFHQAYKAHWGNTLYGRTKREDELEAGIIQRRKMMNRYSPAQPIDVQYNRLVYCVIKQIWLCHEKKISPEKLTITRAYERLQHKILVEDPVLSKLGIPLPKINSKCVRDFIRRQERLINYNATKQSTKIVRRLDQVVTCTLPEPSVQPRVLPPATWEEITYEHIESRAGTKVLKQRSDIVIPVAQSKVKTSVKPVYPTATATATRASTHPELSPSSSQHSPPATSAQDVPSSPQALSVPGKIMTTQPVDVPVSWAKSTIYKRKQKEATLSGVGIKVSRVDHMPVCTLCHGPTQGHQKYKKKSWCGVKKQSTSKGFQNVTYDSFDHFKEKVDQHMSHK